MCFTIRCKLGNLHRAGEFQLVKRGKEMIFSYVSGELAECGVEVGDVLAETRQSPAKKNKKRGQKKEKGPRAIKWEDALLDTDYRIVIKTSFQKRFQAMGSVAYASFQLDKKGRIVSTPKAVNIDTWDFFCSEHASHSGSLLKDMPSNIDIGLTFGFTIGKANVLADDDKMLLVFAILDEAEFPFFHYISGESNRADGASKLTFIVRAPAQLSEYEQKKRAATVMQTLIREEICTINDMTAELAKVNTYIRLVGTLYVILQSFGYTSESLLQACQGNKAIENCLGEINTRLYHSLQTQHPIGSRGFFEHVADNTELGHRVLANVWTCDHVRAKKRSERDEFQLKQTCHFLGSFVNQAGGNEARFLREYFLGKEPMDADKSLYQAIEYSVFRKEKEANTDHKKKILLQKY